MADKQRLGLGIGIISLLFLVIVLGVYFVNDISNGRSQSLTTRASQVSQNLTILSPKSEESIEKEGFFEAKLQTQKDIKILKAVLKVGDGGTLPLSIKKLENSDIILSGYFSVSGISRGKQFIKVYVYDTSGGGVTAIATADVPVLIENP